VNPKKISHKIANILLSKKAKDIVIIDIKKATDIASYFILCTALSTSHSRTLSQEVEKKLKEDDTRLWHIEGYSYGHWILMDYVDVIVHIFLKEDRDYYGIEDLWGDLPQERIEEKS